MGFPGGSDGKESACNVGDLGLIPRLGRSPEEGHGNLLQYFCLKNSMDGEAWQDTVHGIFQARILEWVAIHISKGSFQLRDQTQVSYIAGKFFTSEPLW